MPEKPGRSTSIARWSILVVVSVLLMVGLTLAWKMWRESRSPAGGVPSPRAGTTGHGGDGEHVPLGKNNPPSPQSFHPQQLAAQFPAITELPLLSAEQAQGKIDDAELVLGVEVDGQARAYPINMLTGPSREIFNDELGGAAIAATW